jgi:CRISPR-associated protein Csm2
MTQSARPNQPDRNRVIQQRTSEGQSGQFNPQDIITKIKNLKNKEGEETKGTLEDYSIRELVKDAEDFGNYLSQQGLKANQLRKFLDGINRLKAELAQTFPRDFEQIESELVFLQPRFAYAAARQEGRTQQAAKSLSEVTKAAIEKVKTPEGFDRLVQLIESTIAYHKEAENSKRRS